MALASRCPSQFLLPRQSLSQSQRQSLRLQLPRLTLTAKPRERRAQTRATHRSKASITGNIVKLLQPSLCHISQKKIHRYAAGLARACFDTASALKQASVADVVSAGMPKGHALQVEGTWDTTSSSDTSSTCSSSSQSSSCSGSSSE